MRAEDSAKWLRHIRRKQREIAVLKERVSTLDGMMRGIDYTTPRVSSPPDTDAIPRYVANYIEAKKRYTDLVEEFAQEVIEAHDAIYRLEDERYRMVLELYYLDGRSWHDVARVMGYEKGTVKNLSYDARELLWWYIPPEYRSGD